MRTEPVTAYAQIENNSLRGHVRSGALSLADVASRIVGQQQRLLARPRVQMLYLHYLFPDQEKRFRVLLETLVRTHRLISYSEAVQRVQQGDIDAPYVAFSFDDGVESCLRAARLLEEFGTTGCFFVCPSIVGEQDPVRRAAFCAQRLHMPPFTFMDWSDLEGLCARGHEIGAHTMHHVNLATCVPSEVTDELARCRDVLIDRFGACSHFAWPFGRFAHFSDKAARIAFDVGYASVTSAERGCHTHPPVSDRLLCIRRDHVVGSWPAGHTRAFMARNAAQRMRQLNGWPEGWEVA